MIKKIRMALGMLSGRVFTGPMEVSVDITNRCSVGCITCWFYSPLRDEQVDAAWAKQQMDFGMYTRLIDEFKGMGVEKVMVGGNGEPFVHPQVYDMIDYAVAAGLGVDSATSGVMFTERNLRRLYDAGLETLNISILAGSPETYMKMHPRQKENAYDTILRSLQLLAEWKKADGRKRPVVNLVYVVCRLNYLEVEKIVELACKYGAESVLFKRLATMPFTESLLLESDQLGELDRLMVRCESMAAAHGVRVNTTEFRTLVVHGMADGDYSSRIYGEIPCFIGWIYSRVLCDGTVVPCCGCSGYPMGNVRDRTFREIWYSAAYDEFRRRSRAIRTDKGIAGQCACHSCAHVLVNRGLDRKLKPFYGLAKI